jgi:hypothetical protein
MQQKLSRGVVFFCLALVLTALVVTGCFFRTRRGRRVVVAPGVVYVRTGPPPRRAEVRRACGPTSYWRYGRWVRRPGRWVWQPGRCILRPVAYRRVGCVWVRGGWRRTARGHRYFAGRWRCGAAPIRRPVVVVGPTAMPPAPRFVVRTCPAGSYYKRGRYYWRGRRWVWVVGRCILRPVAYRRPGCRFVRGGWRRVGRRLVWRAGLWRCGARPVVVVGPTAMPPAPRFRVRRCGRNQYYQRGRYHWRGRRWVWTYGRCILRPVTYRRKGCRYVRGGWKRIGGRLRWTAGGWRCGAVRVVRRPVVRRPIRCPVGTRLVGRKCVRVRRPVVRRPIRCPVGTRRVGRKCVRVRKPVVRRPVKRRRCPRGWVFRRGKCRRR